MPYGSGSERSGGDYKWKNNSPSHPFSEDKTHKRDKKWSANVWVITS